jgi:hypothetical protein
MKEKKGKAFNGASLEQALKDGSLTPSGITVVGMVKLSDKDAHISFTPAGCDAWVDIPTKLIEEAQQIGQQRCKDHSHPVFEIKLKESNDPEAKVLASVLSQRYLGGQPSTPYPTAIMDSQGFNSVPGAGPADPVGTSYRRRGPIGAGEYGCCRWSCCWWEYYRCIGPDGRLTWCAKCAVHCCAEFGCEPVFG